MAARLIGAGGILGQIVTIRRVGAAAAAPTKPGKFARPATAAELGLSEVAEHGGLAPELGEGRLPEITGGDGHVRARSDVALGSDSTVVLAGGAGAVSVVLQERRFGVELPEDSPEVRRAFGPDQQTVGPAHRRGPGVLEALAGSHALHVGQMGQDPLVF